MCPMAIRSTLLSAMYIWMKMAVVWKSALTGEGVVPVDWTNCKKIIYHH